MMPLPRYTALCMCLSFLFCINASEGPTETSPLKTVSLKNSLSLEQQAKMDAAIKKKKREYCLKDCGLCCIFTIGPCIPCFITGLACWVFSEKRNAENIARKEEIDKIRASFLEGKTDA